MINDNYENQNVWQLKLNMYTFSERSLPRVALPAITISSLMQFSLSRYFVELHIFAIYYRICTICILVYVSVLQASVSYWWPIYFCLILMPEKFCSFRHIEAHKCNFILLLHFIYILYIFIYLGIHNYNLTTFYI